MLIWRGWGILAVVIPAMGFFLGGIVADVLGVAEGSPEAALPWAGAGLSVGGIATWFFGRRREDEHPDRTLVDPQTGEQVILRERDDLFWIPMKWWGVAAAVLGVAVAVSSLLA